MSAVWIEQSTKQHFSETTQMEWNSLPALDNQPFSVVGDVGFRRLGEHWLTLPSAQFF
jgi:hypothetical protein